MTHYTEKYPSIREMTKPF